MASNFDLLPLFHLFSKPHIYQPAGATPDSLATASCKVPYDKRRKKNKKASKAWLKRANNSYSTIVIQLDFFVNK